MFVSNVEKKCSVRRSASSARGREQSIIVTGGAGFLGSRLCRELIQANHRVLCIDNLLTGSMGNIQDLLPHPDFSFIEHDVIDLLSVDRSVDQIYNLACPASPRRYQSDPLHTFKTCVIGAINMLELAREKSARILQASTSEVYGDPGISPQPESYHGNVNTLGPRSCYDEGKRAAETLFYDYNRSYGLATKIARIFNTYGPDMSPTDGRVVSNFIVQALRDEDITIYGAGTQTRSFCYRDDLIQGLIRLMNSPAKLSHPVNLGNPGEYTILELAEKIIGKVQSKSKLIFQDLPQDDPHQRKPDISVATRVLKWTPSTSLADGLDLTIRHFENLKLKECAPRAMTA